MLRTESSAGRPLADDAERTLPRSCKRRQSSAPFLVAALFAGGVVKDEAAVRAAITSPWSNGQTEG